MRTTGIILLFLLLTGLVKAQNAPYTIQLELVNANVPGIHSGAVVQYQNFWLIIGGRTNGLHGMSSNDSFGVENANNEIIVIDTVTWSYHTKSLNELADSVAAPLRSTNMQFVQEDSLLYMTGGFGFDSTQNKFITFSTITKFNIPNTIQSVINNTPLLPNFQQLKNEYFAICGGELLKQNNTYYLCFGHNFRGRYSEFSSAIFTQVYSNAIRPFQISNSGGNLSYALGTPVTDTAQYHRRDLSVSEFIWPDETPCLMAFGGVFRYDKNLPFLNPVKVNTSSTLSVTTNQLNYQQTYSQYNCANFGVHNSGSHLSTQIFLGGISLNDYNASTGLPEEDTLVPFINDINEFTVDENFNISESINNYPMPGLLGTNATFLINKNLAGIYSDKIILANSVNAGYTLAGYMYGGIKASGANFMPSQVNSDVYRVYIKSNITAVKSIQNNFESFIAPNPAENDFKIITSNNLLGQIISCNITSVDGKQVFTNTFISNLNPQDIKPALAPGTYFITLSNKEKSYRQTHKLIIQ